MLQMYNQYRTASYRIEANLMNSENFVFPKTKSFPPKVYYQQLTDNSHYYASLTDYQASTMLDPCKLVAAKLLLVFLFILCCCYGVCFVALSIRLG